jgi:hypothetical protein
MSWGDRYQLHRRSDTALTSTLRMEAIYFSEILARINETIHHITSKGRSVQTIFWTVFFEYLKRLWIGMWYQSSANMVRWLDAGLSPRRPGFDPRPVHVGFVVEKVTQGQVLSQSTYVSPVSVIPLSVSFHHCSITRVFDSAIK